jgi:cytochrome P450 family 107 subfamily K polypeptide 1
VSDETPPADPALERAFQALRLTPRFHRWATTRVAQGQLDHGLNLPQLVLLYHLGEGVASPAELARRLLVTPAVVTKLVDRLARRGYVRRESDPDDRRRVRLVLTLAGRQVCEGVERELAAELAARLATLSATELDALGDALGLLEWVLAPLDTGGPDRAADASPLPVRWGREHLEEHAMAEAIETTDTTAAPDGAASETTLLDFRDPHFMTTSRNLYATLRDRGPVARVSFAADPAEEDGQAQGLLGRDAYLVTRYGETNAALLDTRFSVDRERGMTEEERAAVPEEFRPLRRNLLGVDPPDHTRLRKLVQPSFTNRAIEALRPRVQALTDELLDDAERAAVARGETAPNRTIELIDAFAYPLPIRVICEMLGIPREDQADVRRWSETLLSGGGQAMTEEARANLAALTAYLRRTFVAKRTQSTDDMITQLVHAEEDGDTLDEEELLAMVFILLLAGHVTTVNLIASGTLALLTHPDQLARLKADPALVKNTVEEVLRYWGPLETALPRVATEDVAIDGAVIPKGETMLAGLASANHDPARFPDPEAFAIGRAEADRHLAFGKGIHVCLGAPLARLEGQVVFGTLFRRFPELRLAVPAAEIAWRPSFLRGLDKLPLLF